MMVYVFAILFRMMLGGIPGKMSEEYGSIRLAMSTLFFRLTLGDEMTESWHNLWELTNEEDNKNIAYVFVFVFLLYMFLSMFTVLNMLIGVLCEVVSAVSKASEEEVKVDTVR